MHCIALLDAVPRCVSVRVLLHISGVFCFGRRRSGSVLFRPARSRQHHVSRPFASMATPQAWLDGVTGAAGVEARAAQPGPRGKSRGYILAYGHNVSRRMAHVFMSEWRKKADVSGETEQDLTDQQVFDWVGYLKVHPDLTKIVPDGKVVVSFAIARLASIDKNTCTGRVDFLVFLDDGICVRLHPSQAQEALLVIVPADHTGGLMLSGPSGRTAMSGTVPEVQRGSHVVAARAVQPGVAAGRAGQPAPLDKIRDHFIDTSESDILQPSFVRCWLAERAELWPGKKFCQEITTPSVPLAPRTGPLPWAYFVAGVPALQAMHPFAAVFVVWLDGEAGRGEVGEAALYFQSKSGVEVVVKLGDSGKKGVTLHSNLVHKCLWNK